MKQSNYKQKRPFDLSKILRLRERGWFALSPNNKYLLAKGKTLVEVLKKAKELGVANPSVFKAAPVDKYLVG